MNFPSLLSDERRLLFFPAFLEASQTRRPLVPPILHERTDIFNVEQKSKDASATKSVSPRKVLRRTFWVMTIIGSGYADGRSPAQPECFHMSHVIVWLAGLKNKRVRAVGVIFWDSTSVRN